MTAEKTTTSFGRYLQTLRLEKGISIEIIASQTRIPRENLVLIEKEDHERLPAEVFVKGFLRAYARAVGGSEDEAVRRYLSSLALRYQAARSEADLKRSSSHFWPRLMVALMLLAAMMVGSIYTISALQPDEKPRETPPAAKAWDGEIAAKPKGAEALAPQPRTADRQVEEIRTPPASAKLVLEIDALADTWMKVIIDDQEPVEYSLKNGDRLALEAAKTLNLLVGNAAGVRMQLNGKRLKPLGKSGQVVNIQLP